MLIRSLHKKLKVTRDLITAYIELKSCPNILCMGDLVFTDMDLTLEQWTPGCGNALYWMLTYVVTVPWPSLTLEVWPLSNVYTYCSLTLEPGCSGAEEYVFTLGFSSFEVHLYLFSLENVPVMFCGCMVNGSVAMVALWVAKGVFPTSITSVISFSLSLFLVSPQNGQNLYARNFLH
jgi:hypothetical protein